MGRYTPPDGHVVQAFAFTVDADDRTWREAARHWGARRKACNWAIATLKADIEAFHATGEETERPSFYGLRKRWNTVKDTVCVNVETGETWWREVSKEAYADGIRAAVDAYYNWQKSRAGERAGRPVGFPRFKKKGRDPDRVTFTTGAIRVEPDRRHVTLPKIGTVRVHENTRKLERLVASDRAKILAVTLRRRGHRMVAVFRVAVARPQQPGVRQPDSRVGVDVGVRTLATVATADGVIERIANPRPLEHALRELRRLNRSRSRCAPGSYRYRQRTRQITRLHARVAAIRAHHIHVLTTRLAKTHGEIVVEGLDTAGMLQQKGLNGARARRRGLSDSALAEPRRQLTYKCGWYGSTLIVADRWFPSSKTCHVCGHIQDIGWAEHWQCHHCEVVHNRDDNAAVNLARYEAREGVSVVGTVGAAVKQGADSQTPSGAVRVGPVEASMGQPREGVRG